MVLYIFSGNCQSITVIYFGNDGFVMSVVPLAASVRNAGCVY